LPWIILSASNQFIVLTNAAFDIFDEIFAVMLQKFPF